MEYFICIYQKCCYIIFIVSNKALKEAVNKEGLYVKIYHNRYFSGNNRKWV